MGALVLGTSDLAKGLRCLHTSGREPFRTSLSWCILAARANDLSILDGVCLDLSDEETFATECRQSREMGFDGKSLIHPKTIKVANELFGSGCEEVEWSRRVIEVHEAAQRSGQGVALLNGKLVENLHVEEATQIVLFDGLIRSRNT